MRTKNRCCLPGHASWASPLLLFRGKKAQGQRSRGRESRPCFAKGDGPVSYYGRLLDLRRSAGKGLVSFKLPLSGFRSLCRCALALGLMPFIAFQRSCF